MTLQQSALTAGASNVDTDRQNTLGQTLNKLSGAALLTYGGQGQAHVTPESLQLSAGQDVITTAGRHASMNVMKKFSLAVGEKLSLFARKLGIQMVAGAGDSDFGPWRERRRRGVPESGEGDYCRTEETA
ncbi:DUF2345 domain-containing protein [Klebsiella aerogenes]